MHGTGQDMCAHSDWFRLCQQLTPHLFRMHAIRQSSALLYWRTCFWMILSAHICNNMSIGSARLCALGSGARSCLTGALARGALAVADPRALGFGPARQAATGLTLPCTRTWNMSISFSLQTATSAHALPITVRAGDLQRQHTLNVSAVSGSSHPGDAAAAHECLSQHTCINKHRQQARVMQQRTQV